MKKCKQKNTKNLNDNVISFNDQTKNYLKLNFQVYFI